MRQHRLTVQTDPPATHHTISTAPPRFAVHYWNGGWEVRFTATNEHLGDLDLGRAGILWLTPGWSRTPGTRRDADRIAADIAAAIEADPNDVTVTVAHDPDLPPGWHVPDAAEVAAVRAGLTRLRTGRRRRANSLGIRS